MMKRIPSLMLFLTILAAGISLGNIVSAKEDASNIIVERTQIKYQSGQLRDPFATCLVRVVKKEESQQAVKDQLAAPIIDLDTFKVEGIIWGGKMPQAIINDKVLAVGDTINGAQILSIDKKGITLNFSGQIVNLSSPGINPVVGKEKQSGL